MQELLKAVFYQVKLVGGGQVKLTQSTGYAFAKSIMSKRGQIYFKIKKNFDIVKIQETHKLAPAKRKQTTLTKLLFLDKI